MKGFTITFQDDGPAVTWRVYRTAEVMGGSLARGEAPDHGTALEEALKACRDLDAKPDDADVLAGLGDPVTTTTETQR